MKAGTGIAIILHREVLVAATSQSDDGDWP